MEIPELARNVMETTITRGYVFSVWGIKQQFVQLLDSSAHHQENGQTSLIHMKTSLHWVSIDSTGFYTFFEGSRDWVGDNSKTQMRQMHWLLFHVLVNDIV